MVFLLIVALVVGAVQNVHNFVMQNEIWVLYPKAYPKSRVFIPRQMFCWDTWDISFEQVAVDKFGAFEQLSTGHPKVMHRWQNPSKVMNMQYHGRGDIVGAAAETIASGADAHAAAACANIDNI